MSTPIDGLRRNLAQTLPEADKECDAKIALFEEQLRELREAKQWIVTTAAAGGIDLKLGYKAVAEKDPTTAEAAADAPVS